MSQRLPAFPERFFAALQTIERLQFHARYLGAFIFGSLARLEVTEKSDCDVQVIINEDNPCTNINHPVIEGVKLDLTTKFAYWSAIIDHILEPLGGRQPIAENNCDCSVCQHDLSMLFSQDQEIHPD